MLNIKVEIIVFFLFQSHINTFRFCRMMMKLSSTLLAIIFGIATANPFAPSKSANDAKSAYINTLMRGARVLRALEQNAQQEVYQVDISSYSVKFEKCQFIKSYDDYLAQDEESDTVLSTKRFVVFRLCPNNSCSSCNYGYGEYIVDLETYLEATVQYQQQVQQAMCNACAECGNWNDDQANQQADEQVDQQADEQADQQADQQADEQADQQADQQADGANRKLAQYSVDCTSCYSECMKIENMQTNGYIDATNFLQCQMIYDPADDGKAALYAGPMCASQGYKIKIGVFTDAYCNNNDSNKDVDDYLVNGDGYAMKLSHALLKTVYAADSCVSCTAAIDENQNADGQQSQVLDMCGQLYDAAAKCEKPHGFDNGFSGYDGFENQVANEGVVCDFIDSIGAGSYDEYGEIVVYGANGSYGGGAKTTGGQKFALTFFILGTVGLAMYAGMLHSKLTKGCAGLSIQGGGAMA